MNRSIHAIHASLLSLAVALTLTACGGGGGDDSSPESASAPAQGQIANTTTTGASLPAERTCGLPNFQQDLLSRINQVRASGRNCGSTAYPAVAALAWNSKLFDAAAAHALDMATKDYFSHVSQDGRTFSQRISAAGYAWTAAGENIAAGQTSVEQVMNGWLDSPAHCANIMSASFSEVGVACVRNDNSTYKYYWAMELGQPR